jgi:hypothetical protein
LGDRISCLLTADGDEQIEAALLGVDLGDVEVEEADRVAPEPGALGLRAVRVGQAGDAIGLQPDPPQGSKLTGRCSAAVQGRAGQVRQGRLQGAEAVVQR